MVCCWKHVQEWNRVAFDESLYSYEALDLKTKNSLR